MDAIKVESLTKNFNGVIAGKTTTINILSTLLKPTSGRGEVAGYDIKKDRDLVRRSIGVVFQEPALDTKLTGRENLEFHAMMYGMGREKRRDRIDEVLVENYSGGMKRRLEIARGLIHKPQVLFLDEPTLGLDAQTRRHIWEYIKKLNKEGEVTIILTSHYMEEADFLCDRIGIIDNGKIVAMGSPEKLKNILGGDVVTIEIDGDTNDLKRDLDTRDWIKTLTHVFWSRGFLE